MISKTFGSWILFFFRERDERFVRYLYGPDIICLLKPFCHIFRNMSNPKMDSVDWAESRCQKPPLRSYTTAWQTILFYQDFLLSFFIFSSRNPTRKMLTRHLSVQSSPVVKYFSSLFFFFILSSGSGVGTRQHSSSTRSLPPCCSARFRKLTAFSLRSTDRAILFSALVVFLHAF